MARQSRTANVRILFFGATADAAGLRDLALQIDDERTISEIVESLKNDHPPLSGLKLLTAVNEEYADADTVLADGDEVAIFTVVSGG